LSCLESVRQGQWPGGGVVRSHTKVQHLTHMTAGHELVSLTDIFQIQFICIRLQIINNRW